MAWTPTRVLLLATAATSAVVFLTISMRLEAQPQPDKPLKFEVSSVKPLVRPPFEIVIAPAGRPIEAHGNRFNDEGSLGDLITDAYNVKGFQLSSLPHWAEAVVGDPFVIDAKAEGTPTARQWRLMLQTLLADRFKLKLHRETKELPVYALVIGKTGSKLRRLSDQLKPEDPPEHSTIPELIYMLAFHVDLLW